MDFQLFFTVVGVWAVLDGVATCLIRSWREYQISFLIRMNERNIRYRMDAYLIIKDLIHAMNSSLHKRNKGIKNQ